MLIFLSIVAAIVLLAFAVSRTPPLETLYRHIEDGADSALYIRRVRRNDFWGNCGPVHFAIPLRIEEFRRITCAPGQAYTAPTSDWYARTWSDEKKEYLDNYAPLNSKIGQEIWYLQIRITRKVAKKLRHIKNSWEGASAVLT